MTDIILASTSPYRRQLMQRLQIPFRCLSPGVDESPMPGEAPAALAQRLALAKSEAIALANPTALVIGSDQVAAVGGEIMGKPGTHEAAAAQLRASSGREVCFATAVSLTCARRNLQECHLEPFSAHFRPLDDATIENYLRREQPYDCAGSFKCEGLGIALFTGLRGNDPTSLQGLPLIALVDLLARAGVAIPGPPDSTTE